MVLLNGMYARLDSTRLDNVATCYWLLHSMFCCGVVKSTKFTVSRSQTHSSSTSVGRIVERSIRNTYPHKIYVYRTKTNVFFIYIENVDAVCSMPRCRRKGGEKTVSRYFICTIFCVLIKSLASHAWQNEEEMMWKFIYMYVEMKFYRIMHHRAMNDLNRMNEKELKWK